MNDYHRHDAVRRTSPWLRLVVPGLVVAVLGPGLGCQRSLFTEETERTQFDSYNRVRQRYVPTEEPDVFGNPQPALRARLTRTR